jgi:hypothetical protein
MKVMALTKLVLLIVRDGGIAPRTVDFLAA